MFNTIKKSEISRLSIGILLCSIGLLGSNAAMAGTNFQPKNRASEAADALGKASITQLPAPSAKYPLGEKLVYKINWWGMEIGTGVIELNEDGAQDQNGQLMYRIDAAAKDNSYLHGIFPVEDTFGSRMAPEGHSLSFIRDVKEGKYRANEITDFDYAQNTAERRSLTDGSVKQSEVSGPIHDVLTAFYWARRQPIQVGETAYTTIFLKEKIWEVGFKAKEIKSFSLPGQASRDVVVLVPEVRLNGKPANRAKAKIYATADERRIPLMIRLDTPYGPVTGVLQNAI
jgi:hypothetical protein